MSINNNTTRVFVYQKMSRMTDNLRQIVLNIHDGHDCVAYRLALSAMAYLRSAKGLNGDLNMCD